MSELASEPASTVRPRMRTPSASEVASVSELSIEPPDEDAESEVPEVADEDEDELSGLPLEVNEADAAEQSRDAGYDDDEEDYR